MTNHKHKMTDAPKADPILGAQTYTDEWPPPVVFLNYPGYHLGQVGQLRGPMLSHTTQDQLLTVVSESYDTVAHRTRHGLTYGIVTKRAAA